MVEGARSALHSPVRVESIHTHAANLMNELPSRGLRHRVRTLSTILGETMTQQHGQGFLEKVEEIRL